MLNYFIPNDNTNILRFTAFKNLHTITMTDVQRPDWDSYDELTESYDYYYYPFSLSRLLSIIMETKITTVNIYGESAEDNSSWLCSEWSKSLSGFKMAGYEMNFSDEDGYQCISIKRQSTH